jgi:hypothetical protein
MQNSWSTAVLHKYGNYVEPNEDLYREESCVVTFIKGKTLILLYNVVMFIVILR